MRSFISEILLLVTATFIIQEKNISDLKKKKKEKAHSVKCNVICCDKGQIKTTKLFQLHHISVNVPSICDDEECNLKYTFGVKITKEKNLHSIQIYKYTAR